MATKHKPLDKNVECFSNTKGDFPMIRRIPFGNSGFRTGTLDGTTVNCKSNFVFSNRKACREKSTENVSIGLEDESLDASENEGSKGDIERKPNHENELSRSLGCDGDATKFSPVSPTKFYLCSSGANGDILKPLDEYYIKSLENKNLLSKSMGSSGSKLNTSPDEAHSKVCTSSMPEKKTDFLSFLTSLVSNWKGNSNLEKLINLNENKIESPSMVVDNVRELPEPKFQIDIETNLSEEDETSKELQIELNIKQSESHATSLKTNNEIAACESGEESSHESLNSCESDDSASYVFEEEEEEEKERDEVENEVKEEGNTHFIQETIIETCCKEKVNCNIPLLKGNKVTPEKPEPRLKDAVNGSDVRKNKDILKDKKESNYIKHTDIPLVHKAIKPFNIGESLCKNEENDEKEIIDQYIFEVERKLAWKKSLQVANENVNTLRPDESYFTKLDSGLKKNTSFVKKLKNFSSNHLESMLKDVYTLNLTRYLSEVAAAIVQAKLKILDIAPAVELCNAIHHLYAEFSPFLLQSFQRYLASKEDNEMTNCRKLNVDLKFYVELMSVGILSREDAFQLILLVLSIAVNRDKAEYNNASLLTSFYRHCKEGYAVPRRMRNLAEKYGAKLPSFCLLLRDEDQKIKALLSEYYSGLMEYVIKIHFELHAYERQNKKMLQLRGELSKERKDKSQELKALKERLWNGLSGLAEVLDEVLPDLIEVKSDDCELTVLDGSGGGQDLLWEDKEEQQFYEKITDLREFLPTIPQKSQSAEVLNVSNNESVSKSEESVLKNDESMSKSEDSEDESIKEKNDKKSEKKVATELSTNNRKMLETFMSMLSSCLNCEIIDHLAVEFITSFNNKGNRKKLTNALFSVPRNRSDLLPFYSRLVATLNPFIPEIATELCQLLKQDFKYHIRKKDQINIESKLKVVRFIGELVKFKMYSKLEALYCLKLLLRDFSYHHIEMFCLLLETCGRYLFRNNDSHQQVKVYLEQMMRKKSVTALDPRYVTMIENAFYYVDPPCETMLEKKEELPPLQEFIQRILYQELSKSNIEDILQLMCKVDWEDTELFEFSVECLTMAYNVKFNNIEFLASIVSGLTYQVEHVGILVVDGVMEDIRLGMEINLPMHNQRRLAMVKYIGELYKYRVTESGEVFQVLYSLISFGVTLSYANPSYLDPSKHLFRIRLTCTLLDSCGKYFVSGSSSKKLSYFLTYFQRYFWFKYEDPYWKTANKPFPVRIHYLFKDALLALCPQIHLFSSLQEANEAVRELEQKLTSKISDSIPGFSILSHAITTIEEEHESSFEDSEGYNAGDEESLRQDVFISSDLRTSNENHQVEDDCFVSEFEKIVSENIQTRMFEMVKPQYVDIPVPLDIKNSKKSCEQLLEPKSEEKPVVNFVLLMKKGHKQHYKQIDVPKDSELAIKLKTGKEAEKAEKERVKRLTLDMSKRLEEESYQEFISQTQKTNNPTHQPEKKYRYHQHNQKSTTYSEFFFRAKKVK